MDTEEVIGDLGRGEDVVTVLPISEVVVGEVCSLVIHQLWSFSRGMSFTYPDMISSSSTPYSFMCCSPHPSLIRRGINFLRKPKRFGVWNMRISTRSGPKSSTSGAKSDALDGSGVSRVPRSASVRKETLRSGLRLRESRMTAI